MGIHFWFSFIGLLIYGIALMIGGTEQGESWIKGEPFIESVKLMSSYWLWRAVSGNLMFLGHLVFAYNIWRMRPAPAQEREAATEGEPA